MRQSKLISIIEVILNVVSGFIIAMLVWKYIIPEMFPRMAGPMIENFMVTLTFTTVSILRGYFWRRFFNNGVHATVANWVGTLWTEPPPDIAAGDRVIKFMETRDHIKEEGYG